MTQKTSNGCERDTVIIVGGRGGLIARYRDAVEKFGYQCRCYEERMAPKRPPPAKKIALVIVIVTMVSHSLLAQARAIADGHERIVYLKSPSVSSIRQTVEAMTEARGVRYV
jgi:hypothetical protein